MHCALHGTGTGSIVRNLEQNISYKKAFKIKFRLIAGKYRWIHRSVVQIEYCSPLKSKTKVWIIDLIKTASLCPPLRWWGKEGRFHWCYNTTPFKTLWRCRLWRGGRTTQTSVQRTRTRRSLHPVLFNGKLGMLNHIIRDTTPHWPCAGPVYSLPAGGGLYDILTSVYSFCGLRLMAERGLEWARCCPILS